MALRSGYKGFKKLLGLKMIRPGTLAVDDTVLSETFFPRSEQAVLGAKNINGTKYITDTVFTVNSDDSVTVNVENSPTNYTNGLGTGYGFVAPFTGQVKLTGGVNANFHIFAWDVTDNNRPYKDSTKTARWTSSDNQYGDTPQSFYMIEGHTYQMVIRIMTGATIDNVTMYPMLVLDSETDLSFTSPAMTNKELTEFVNDITEVDLTSSVNTTNFTVGSGGSVKYVKKGNTCTVTIENVTPESTGNNKALLSGATIPKALMKTYGVAAAGNGDVVGLINIPDDYVALNVKTASAIYSSVTYIMA